MRTLRQISKSFLHAQFIFFQRFGFDILPRHFYSEIPDINRLRNTQPWRKEYSMSWVEGASCDDQLSFVKDTVTRAATRANHNGIYDIACRENGAPGYGPIEAQFLYSYVAAHQPRVIIQIGAGVSTSVIMQAAGDSDYRPTLICIDPYPTHLLRRLAAAKDIELLEIPVQELEPDTLSMLTHNDLLFIDSTHVLGPAGEVTRLVVEWLPRLKPGVRVHFHDITFPYDYEPNVLNAALFFQHESALLHSFLCMNPFFRILCSLSMLHHGRQPQLAEVFPDYTPSQMEDGLSIRAGHFPSSIYIERKV